MKLGRSFRFKFLLFIAICVIVISVTYFYAIISIPNEVTLLEGEEYSQLFKSPFLINLKLDHDEILHIKSGKASAGIFTLSNPVSMKAIGTGSARISMNLLGLIPLRTMQVDVVSQKELVACGRTVGVKLKVDGILVIGVSDVEAVNGQKHYPARDSGIKNGDILTEVNGKRLSGIDSLIREIDSSNGNAIRIKFRRIGQVYEADVKPVKAMDDKKYHIGLWVRDSTAGIGTLTFFDPITKSFGALGHGITDIDTGALMPVEEGEILNCDILGIKKGEKGEPGEMKGIFSGDGNRLGTIELNSEHGIYGVLNHNSTRALSYKSYPIGLRSKVKEGNAVILCTLDGKNVNEYSIEILRVSRQNLNGSKGMVIRITDERLLEKTGGIIQGMSGSPIIQNGNIIGAVTHVLVNDPTRGYGIFIEGMLRNISGNKLEGLREAG